MVNITHRRNQLKLFKFQSELAWKAAMNGNLAMLEHNYWHELKRIGIDSVTFLLDIECTLIPNMEASPEWSVLVEEVKDTVHPLRRAYPGPVWGCPKC